jgi:hypothetical protein
MDDRNFNKLHQKQEERASCKTDTAGLIFWSLGAKAEDAGGHFWHDGFLKTNIITPAKWILPNAN